MRKGMRSEHGQATVEWTALLLLIALALLALSRLAPKADGHELGTTLAHAVTRQGHRAQVPAQHPKTQSPPVRVQAVSPMPLPQLPASLKRAGRGAGALWRKAWFACLVYERTRYAFRHPDSRIPGYTLPYGTALRMINNCVSPVDLLRDVQEPDLGR
jgi:Flp pilus assembly pilin Flp